MISRPLTKWLNYYSPLFGGQFDFFTEESAPRMDSWANALVLLGGWHWVRIKGGHNLRRSSDSSIPTLDDPIIGVADGAAATIKTNWLVGHAASSRYIYRLTAVGGGGVEDDGRTAIVEVTTDGAGALANPIPNRVADLQATPQTAGTFAMRWTYLAVGQAAAPKYFRVYSDSGTGTIDYVTPIGTVSYTAGSPTYSFTTGVLTGVGDTVVQFVVRSESTAGAQEKNEMVATARGRSTAPYSTLATSGQAEASQAMSLPDVIV